MKALPLEKIAQLVDGRILGDSDMLIKGVQSLETAGPGDISFFADKRFKESLKKTAASAVIISEKTDIYQGPQVLVSDAALAFAKVTRLFAPPIPRHDGVSDRAFVHVGSVLGKGVSIYPNVYVGEGADIGDETILFPGVYVGNRVKVGKRSVIYPNVSILDDCLIGEDVIIHAGAVIGSDGFGYVKEGSRSLKVPQIGIVQIDDQVEIGANTCIDRAALGRTWLRRSVKVDNLVQVGHNVVIGEDSVVVALTGFSGSVNVGREVTIAGQVGFADHLDVGDRAVIGPKSGVAKSVGPEEVLSGCPAIPHRLWLKTSGLIKKLPQIHEALRNLEKRVEKLEKQA